jgi:hypothetical protein
MRDFQDRLDPDDNFANAANLSEALRNPVVRMMFRLSGRPPGELGDEIDGIVDDMRRFYATPDRVAQTVTPLGWCVHSQMMVEPYNAAADLVDAGDTEAAESFLDAAWNEDDRLRIIANRIKTLYAADDERRLHRWQALDEALRCHELGLYPESCVPRCGV